ncbi:MAG: hypothetical protein ACE5FG_14385, partial [Myxococcota bacterium]
CAAKTLNPCAAKTLNPCAAKTLNPCAAKTLNPCAAKTLNPCAAKTLNPCVAKTLNPCRAKTLNPCAAKKLNPCSSKGSHGAHAYAMNPCNPCGGRNPCNPCSMKGKNPCNPCGGKNPCNPCGGARIDASRFKAPADVKLAGGSRAGMIARGEELWKDRKLGNSGLACASCHIGNYGQMQPSFAKPYPHRVAMPYERAGVGEVTAAEMVQFCMLVPMMSEPFPWDSRDLAALTAFVESIQPGFKPNAGGGNPCNPCSMKRKNPCNPCGGRW